MSLIRGSVLLFYLARISAAMRRTDHVRMEDYALEREICGHHVYKTSWTPVIGQMFRQRAVMAMTDTTTFSLINGRVAAAS